jgi:hypothetical protein
VQSRPPAAQTILRKETRGAVADKSQLSFYRDLLATTRDKVAALKKQGRSLDEVVAAKPTEAYDAQWGGGFMSPRGR